MSYEEDDPYLTRYSSTETDSTALFEMREFLMLINNELKILNSKIGKGGKGAEGVKEVEELSKTLGDSKTKKSAKGLTGMFKSMAAASGQAFLMEQLMKLLEPFLMLLEPIALLFDILGGLFAQMAGPILQSLFAALQPLFEALINLSPIFVEIGQIIARLIGAVLEPLMNIFMALWPVIEGILHVVVQLLEIALKPLELIFKLIGWVLEPLLPVFSLLGDIFGMIFSALDPLMPLLDGLEPVFRILAYVIGVILLGAIYGIGVAIAFVVDAVTGIIDFIDFLNLTPIRATNYVATWNDMILPIMAELTASGPEGLGTPQADGGVFTKATRVTVGEVGAERVGLERNASTISDNDEYLIDMRDGISELVSMNRKQARRVNKRRFG